jgi:regulator of cell morphogenesis and NO signaling
MPHSSVVPIPQRTLADLVTENARAASVFERFGLDYCCHGRQSVEDAVARKGASLSEVVNAIDALGTPSPDDTLPADWEHLDHLTRYIVTHHHRYVRESCPQLTQWLDKLVARHGPQHSELAEVRRTFYTLAEELLAHMQKEENVLFPFIDDLAAANRSSGRLPAGPFGMIQSPVRVMEADHELAGELVARLNSQTGGYTPPPDGCNTYRLCYAELARFERDLHQHIHLENNVLFPRAIELETRTA